MPGEWRGRWFEGGVGDVTITAYAVLNKGECIDNINDYYLLDNRCLTLYYRAHFDLDYRQWRRHGKGGWEEAGAVPPTLSGVDFEISANPMRKLVR